MPATVLRRHGYSLVIYRPKTSPWSYFRPIVVVKLQFESEAFVQDHVWPQAYFSYNFLQKQHRAMRMVSLRSSRQDASIDMHIDFLRSRLDFEVT